MISHRRMLAFAAAFACSSLAGWAQTLPPVPAAPISATGTQSGLPDEPVANRVPFDSASSSALAGSVPIPQVTVLEDTLIRVITSEPISSKRIETGSPLLFLVSEDVVIGGVVAIPRGATVHGTVMKAKKAGVLTGSPELILELTSLDLGARSYPLYSYQFNVKGTSKTGPTETKALRGAAIGTIAGALVGGVSAKGGSPQPGAGNPVSMATGAAVGAGVGTAVSAATPGHGIRIPSESQVDFYLAAPITVVPVNAKEATRLAQGLHAGGPTLYVRDNLP